MDDSKNEIEAELDSDEPLLWSGRPRQGVVFRGSDVIMIPFSLLWGGFAIFWESIAVSIIILEGQPMGFLFVLFGLPSVLLGLYLILGRFWVDARIRGRTYYGVTANRVIIISGFLWRKVSSLDLRTLTDVSLTEKSNRNGTITFGPVHPFALMYGGMPWPGMGRFSQTSFEMIPNARDVYNVIREAKDAT